jgi:heme/copper-type cytochrome/quinol oxidase subunit 4
MESIVYILCALTSLACAILLLRTYKHSQVRLLFWCGLCFVGLALNNVLLFFDLKVFPQTDLFLLRSLPALVGVLLLIYGLIWDAE